MSAPDPEKWQATGDELAEHWTMAMLFQSDGAGFIKHTEGIVNAVARRRALAELKALAKLECSCCRSAEDLRPGGFHYDCEGKYLALCDAEHIHDRIAEIEAEG